MGYFNEYSIRDDIIKPMLDAELPGSKERGEDDNGRIIFFEPASPLLGKTEIRYFKDQSAASRARRAYKGLWCAGPVGYWHHVEQRWIG